MLRLWNELNDQIYYSFHHPRRYAKEIGQDWHQLAKRVQRFDIDLARARVLDVGCGTFYPYVILFHQVSEFVCGIDPVQLRLLGESVNDQSSSSPRSQLNAARLRARDTYFRHTYYRELARGAGITIKRWDVNLYRGDAASLPFPDNSFDLVVSRAAFEHIPNVQAAVVNIARVLRPGGLADITIHLFTSLSGGHEKAFWDFRRPSGRFAAWAHLRDPHWASPLYLNRLHESDYRRAFVGRLEIVDWLTHSTEGADLLDDTLLLQLPGYTAEDLSKRMITVIAQKPGAPFGTC